MAHILIMLSVDAIIYSVLTWYLDAVFPGSFGIPQPFYFLFTVSIMCILRDRIRSICRFTEASENGAHC